MRHQVIALALIIVFVPVAIAAPPRAIPGITAKDVYPAACVDCHVKDNRVSALLARWNGSVDATKVRAMQAFVPKSITLKGKHPAVAAKDIPASCMKCHAATSKTMPTFAPLMHGIHLAKADQSEFVKQYGGECTHCHKLNRANGAWSLPSGAEK
jgi:nitrate/TMAO reductase-like tetraheme cytochrome c subunit